MDVITAQLVDKQQSLLKPHKWLSTRILNMPWAVKMLIYIFWERSRHKLYNKYQEVINIFRLRTTVIDTSLDRQHSTRKKMRPLVKLIMWYYFIHICNQTTRLHLEQPSLFMFGNIQGYLCLEPILFVIGTKFIHIWNNLQSHLK